MSFRMLAALLPLLAISPALAQTAPSSPNEHGIFDSGSETPGSEGFLTKQMLDTKLGSYATVDALIHSLDAYQTQAAETYLPKAGGAITGDITATPDLWGATAHFGGKSLYGQFSGPFTELGQGTGLAWNELNGVPGAVLYGETDFYNLHGTGSGGYTFCDGGTETECKSNIVLSITSGGSAWLRSLTLAGSAGSGNAYACINASGQLYRSATACQ